MRDASRCGERGFVALVSVVVMVAVLTALMYTVSASGFYARQDSLNAEFRRISLGLAESCANVALLALATSTDPMHYSSSHQVVHIGTDAQGRVLACTIDSIGGYGGVVRSINTSAGFMNAYASAAVETVIAVPVSAGSLTVASWQTF